ncbi:MAG: hypothetical protein KAQ95_11290 [Candidatus Heimdallarchaeota archaeon]|nr:hypothetical protein [Candidatus Heimdallarchaeota archaeon]
MVRMQGLKKTAFILIVSAAILLYNIGTYDLIANQGVDILTPMYNEGPPGETEIIPNVDQEIDPPLGNQTNLPKFNTIFTMMVFNFPIELAIVFFAEMVFSSIVREDRKKLNFLRLLILLGSASALTVVNSLNHYFLIWPAIHDWPIHAGHEYNDTTTLLMEPLYGENQDTFFSPAVTILIFIAAAIIILGIHFLAFKFIQKLSITCSGVSLLMPAIYYPVIWNAMARQTRHQDLFETTGTQFMFALVISGIFLLAIILILIWNLTLVGTKAAVMKPQETETQEKYEPK